MTNHLCLLGTEELTRIAGPLVLVLATVSWTSTGCSPLGSIPLVPMLLLEDHCHTQLFAYSVSKPPKSPIASTIKFRPQSLAPTSVTTLVSVFL